MLAKLGEADHSPLRRDLVRDLVPPHALPLQPHAAYLNAADLPRLSTAGKLECATRLPVNLSAPEMNHTGVMTRLIKLPEQPARAYDHLFMVALLGDAGCGKSCALKRFAEDRWLDEGPTIGVEMRMRSLLVGAKDTVVRLQLWDASGAELGGAELGGPSSLDSMCVGVHGVVVMYDAQKRSSFVSVPKWVERAAALAPQNASRLLLGTKYDDEPPSDDAAAASHRSARGARGAPASSRAASDRVDEREASRLAQSHKMLFAAASALDGSGVDEAFAMLAEHLLAKREGSDAEAEQRQAEVVQRQRSPLRPLETALETRAIRERSRSPQAARNGARRFEPGPLSAGSLNGALNGSLSGSRSPSRSPTRSAGSRSGSFGTSRSRTAARPSAAAERELQAVLKRCIQCFLPPPPFVRPRASSPGRGAMMMVPAQRSTAAAASAAKARARARSPTGSPQRLSALARLPARPR